MAAQEKTSSTKKDKGIIAFFKRLFGKSSSTPKTLKEEELRLEPKYWQEVIDFMTTLKNIVHKHTIDDDNVRHVNDRIITYVEEQINKKGAVKDRSQRYAALDTLADRILVNNLSKIAGLKHTEGTEFSEAVKRFKEDLHRRQTQEEAYLHSKKD